VRTVLIDAGPLVALFAADDKHHHRYRDLILGSGKSSWRLLTTWPCVVEASHILAARQRLEMLAFVQLGGVQIVPFEAANLEPMRHWMHQYSEREKREMDLADASLYWVAMQLGIREIMTIDHNDFERYRLEDQRYFQII
jgi:hypothetical protein